MSFTVCRITSWERPAEMGAAPMATGWFGRGAAGSQAAQHYEGNNEKYLKRPARKQKEHIEAKQVWKRPQNYVLHTLYRQDTKKVQMNTIFGITVILASIGGALFYFFWEHTGTNDAYLRSDTTVDEKLPRAGAM